MTLRSSAKRLAWHGRLLDGLARVRRWRGAAVLCYHAVRATDAPPPDLAFAPLHVPVSRLADHLAALARLCTPVTLADMAAALAGTRPLPPRAVHLSFDDGYRSVLARALPLLERNGVPASVFVCAGPVRDRTLFWYDARSRQAGDAAVTALVDGGGIDWSAAPGPSPAAAADDELCPLTIEEVQRLAAHPLVEIGSHTENHLPLARLPDHRQRDEIATGVRLLHEWTGRRPWAFAYPFGRPGCHYAAPTLRALGEAGVSLAFTTVPGWSSASHAPLEQPRFVMTDGVDGVELAYRLAWRWAR